MAPSATRPPLQATWSRANSNMNFIAEDADTVTSHAPLNVVIPIGGIGSRFQKVGYRYPKPLINIVGRPMLFWVIERLEFKSDDTLWIAYDGKIDDEFHLGEMVIKEFPSLDIRLVRLNYSTRGAAETLFIISQSMPVDHRTRRTISLDCDTIYTRDVLNIVRSLEPAHGGCIYFEDTGNKPIFSYIKTDGTDKHLIVELAEKKAISSKANTGAYIFPSAEQLRQHAGGMLDSILAGTGPRHIGDEYYTSHLISQMIHEIPFTAIEVTTKDFHCVGTPRQLEDFLTVIKEEPALIMRKRRFCFDLDMTLLGHPKIAGDYSTCPPIPRNIQLVRELHKAGHHIILQTARRMRTHNGNVGAVIADIGSVTFASLTKYDIPYDEIFFGKPWAHVYVDDLAVNANLDTFRETGWLAQETTAINLLASKAAQKAGFVAPRSFNHLQIVGEQIIKSSQSSQLLGEIFFYLHLPTEIIDLFPRIYNLDYFHATTTYTLTMERVEGVTFSHLLVGRALTPGRLVVFLQALHRIHTSGTTTESVHHVSEQLQKMLDASTLSGEPNIYANYTPKIKERYEQYRKEYEALGPDASATFYTLVERLARYEGSRRAVSCDVIHGDPVFSNAMLDQKNGKVRFFDVRSRLGHTLSQSGDLAYDLAKVLQSLHGYDHVILGTNGESLEAEDGLGVENLSLGVNGNSRSETPSTPSTPRARSVEWDHVEPEDEQLLHDLQEVFWKWVEETYSGKVRRQDVRDITASLLFSLIPLHRAELRRVFLDMAMHVLDEGDHSNATNGNGKLAVQ